MYVTFEVTLVCTNTHDLRYGYTRLETCTDQCWANASNWDVERIEMCKGHNVDLAKALPTPPSGIMEYIDLKNPDHPAWPSGSPQGELSFDPAVRRAPQLLARAQSVWHCV